MSIDYYVNMHPDALSVSFLYLIPFITFGILGESINIAPSNGWPNGANGAVAYVSDVRSSLQRSSSLFCLGSTSIAVVMLLS